MPSMARFLHLADIHLGFDRYGNAERTRDFFFALEDVLQRYAIDAKVDFVLIAGDLFEYRQILPGVLNQAKSALGMLRKAGIPVLAIEGNHDHRPFGSNTSWLRHLADWGDLILLEPDQEEDSGETCFRAWDPETLKGGYIDLDCGVRVYGSHWYGSAAPQMIPRLAAAIAPLPPAPGPQVMLFHHGLEGQIARYAGALRREDLEPLRAAGIDYLALGHIHKHYAVDDWIFNPGSLEANSIAEGQDQMPRGALLVELEPGRVSATLQQDYEQRPITRLRLDVEKRWSLAQVQEEARRCIRTARNRGRTEDAVVELRICGQVGFSRLDLDVRRLREELLELSGALILLLRSEIVGSEYETPLPQAERLSPQAIESVVFGDLLAANEAYAPRANQLARVLCDLKTDLLEKRSEADLYAFLEELLTDSALDAAGGITGDDVALQHQEDRQHRQDGEDGPGGDQPPVEGEAAGEGGDAEGQGVAARLVENDQGPEEVAPGADEDEDGQGD